MVTNPCIQFKGENRKALQELYAWESFTITEENTKAMLTRCKQELDSVKTSKRSSNQILLLNKLNTLLS